MLKWKFSLPLLATLFFSLPIQLFGAACCGGGANFPLLITGDFRGQLATSMSAASIVGDADSSGLSTFRQQGNDEYVRRFLIEGTYQLTDALQAGVTLPFEYRERSFTNNTTSDYGLADISAQMSYEFLPERGFSLWQPRGFIFIRTTLPTSPSIYNSQDLFASDARGQGQLNQSLGLAFIKNWQHWDAQLMFEAHHSFAKQYSLTDGSLVDVSSAQGLSGLISAGYNLVDLRLGLSLSPKAEGSREILTTTGASERTRQIVWDTVFSLSYLFNSDWLSILSYSDQTLWGPAENTSLSRALGFSLQRRWAL